MADILIADDNTSILESLEILLTSMGHTTTTASSVREVFEVYNCKKETSPFDLIITDWHMPNPGDGLLVLQYLSADGYPCPVIVHSGEPKDKRFPIWQEAFTTFASLHWVEKPIGDLIGTINRCLNTQKPPS